MTHRLSCLAVILLLPACTAEPLLIEEEQQAAFMPPPLPAPDAGPPTVPVIPAPPMPIPPPEPIPGADCLADYNSCITVAAMCDYFENGVPGLTIEQEFTAALLCAIALDAAGCESNLATCLGNHGANTCNCALMACEEEQDPNEIPEEVPYDPPATSNDCSLHETVAACPAGYTGFGVWSCSYY